MLWRGVLVRTDVSMERIYLHRLLRLLVTANVVPSSTIIVTLMMEALRSSETLFLQELHGITSEKTALFKLALCLIIWALGFGEIREMEFIGTVIFTSAFDDWRISYTLGHFNDAESSRYWLYRKLFGLSVDLNYSDNAGDGTQAFHLIASNYTCWIIPSTRWGGDQHSLMLRTRLRHYAINRKVPNSLPDDAMELFHRIYDLTSL
jgi:hypothetical protein